MLTKVHNMKAVVFPVVLYSCEIWTIKKAECWRIYAFELRFWRRFLRVPRSTRRSNQPILEQINPEYLLEWLMLKLKLQYFHHLMGRADSLKKILMQGKIESRRRRGWQRMTWHHWFNGHGFGWTLGVGDGQGGPACCGSWALKESDTTEGLNWTEFFATPWTAARPWNFSGKDIWVCSPFPGDLPYSGIKPTSLMSSELKGRKHLFYFWFLT